MRKLLLTYKGKTKSITDWGADTGINRDTIYNRLRWGWTAARALSKPVRRLQFLVPGTKYGKWTVIGRSKKVTKSGKKDKYTGCRCSCGTLRAVVTSMLVTGRATNCGCKRAPPIKSNQCFGRWTIIRAAGSFKRGGRAVLCRCTCGTKRVCKFSVLKTGRSRSCGCLKSEMAAKASKARTEVIKPGTKFHRWTILRDYKGKRAAGKHRLVWAQCDCGVIKTVALPLLKRGHSKSCGCYRIEINASRVRTHGGCRLPEYGVWCNMLGRCRNKNDTAYHRYGGRGIKVCKRWKSFKNFLADMGRRPSNKHQIDRERNNGDYKPSNCRWLLSKENSRNTSRAKKISFRGKLQTAGAWGEELGVAANLIRDRLRRGWPIKDALLTPKGDRSCRSSKSKKRISPPRRKK